MESAEDRTTTQGDVVEAVTTETPAVTSGHVEAGAVAASEAKGETPHGDEALAAARAEASAGAPTPDDFGPTAAGPEPDATAQAWTPPAGSGDAAVISPEKPELPVLGAFAGGFVLATILKRLGG